MRTHTLYWRRGPCACTEGLYEILRVSACLLGGQPCQALDVLHWLTSRTLRKRAKARSPSQDWWQKLRRPFGEKTSLEMCRKSVQVSPGCRPALLHSNWPRSVEPCAKFQAFQATDITSHGDDLGYRTRLNATLFQAVLQLACLLRVT